jgi:sugar phosphate permease
MTFYSIAQAPNAKTIYALRVLLGLFSAVFWPTAVSMIFNWYTPAELAKRVAFFNVSDAAGGMFLSALQAALYTNMDGVHGISGWQWLFIISGTITIGQGLLGLVIIPDSPVLTRAIWLTDAEKRIARKRMADFGANTSNMIPTQVVVQKLRKLLVHPVTYFFLAAFALQAWANRANSYFTLYLKALEDSSGNLRFSTYQVNVIPMGGYALQILINLGLNALSDWKQWRWQISIAPAFLLGIVLSVLSAWPSDWRVIITFYFLTYATNAGSPSLLAWMAELLRKEPEVRSIIVALTVTIVYIGHATIPIRVWRTSDSPRYPIGFPLATAFVFSSIFVQLGMLWWGRRNPQLARYGYDVPSNVSARSDEESSQVIEDESVIQQSDSKAMDVEISRVQDK